MSKCYSTAPRYQQPTWEELEELHGEEPEEYVACETCKHYAACTKGEAVKLLNIMSQVAMYVPNGQEVRTDAVWKCVKRAVPKMGVCVHMGELVAAGDCKCDEYEERL